MIASDFLARLMDRHPVIVYVGAAILGRVAGDMIMTDPTVIQRLHPGAYVTYSVEATLAVAVVAAGWTMQRRAARRVAVVREERDRAA
jgi:predicted tellurium resistance membrane protein TerC